MWTGTRRDGIAMRVALGVVVAMAAVAAGPAVALQRAERTLELEGALAPETMLALDNLLGSVRLEPSMESGRFRIEARVVAEAKHRAEAEALAGAVELTREARPGRLHVAVGFPVERARSFRQPKAGIGGLLARWSKSLTGGDPLLVTHAGRSVELGQGRKATALAVELTVTVPLDARVTARLVAGTIEARGVRGELTLEAQRGEIVVDRVYGTVRASTGQGVVQVEHFHGDELELRSGAGDCVLRETRAERTAVSAHGGAVRGSHVRAGELTVEASGAVHLELVDAEVFDVASAGDDVELSSYFKRTRRASIAAGGDVVLHVGEQTDFALAASTKSGAVETLGLTFQPSADEAPPAAWHARRGLGGPDVQVSAPAGSLTVRPYGVTRLELLRRR